MNRYEVILTVPVRVVVEVNNPFDVRSVAQKKVIDKSYQSLDVLRLKQPVGAITNHPVMISTRLVA